MPAPNQVIATPLAELHRTQGAAIATWFGCALPDHWIDPRAEQQFALDSVALIDKNYRAYFSFSGPDRVRYLNAILTNNVKDLAVGRGNVSLLLHPQGRILAEIETYASADSLFCVSYAMIRQQLIEWLDKYIIMDDVTLTDETERYGTLALEGPTAAGVALELTGIDLSVHEDLEQLQATVASIPCRITKRSPGGTAGCEFLVDRKNLLDLWQILSAAVKKHGGGPMGYPTRRVCRTATLVTPRAATRDKKLSSAFARAARSTGGALS